MGEKCVGALEVVARGNGRDAEPESDLPDEPRAVLYALRIVDRTDCCDSLVERYRLSWVRELCAALEVVPPAEHSAAETAKFKEGVAFRLTQFEATAFHETVLTRNLFVLSQQLGLSPLESDLLGLAALFKTQGWLYSLAELASHVSLASHVNSEQAVSLLATMVHASPAEVRRCLLARDAKLTRSGLLQVTSERADLPDKLGMISGLAGALLSPGESPLEFLTSRCLERRAAELGAADFEHLDGEFELVERLVPTAVRRRTPGINLLIYGPPGTGKTEFVRALAAKSGLTLWEVGHKDSEGNSASGGERLMQFCLAQALFAEDSRAAILFDEFEDVLVPEESRNPFSPPRKISKAFLHDLLETNHVPTFWISNEPCWLDGAARRRFTHAIEMQEPPRPVTERIFAAELSAFGLEAGWAARVSADERLVPAHAARVRRVLEHAEPPDPEAAARMAERVLGGCVALKGGGGPLRTELADAAGYRLGFLNADCDLRELARGIVRAGHGRLCLEGPPGTGKTAFARHLARRLGRHLLIRRSSDLLGPFVGMTERLIAAAFVKAERDNAVLLIDEIEGFLQTREGSRHSWEITQVNEMLTRLETYPGVFVATTNLARTLDVAARRRFDAFVNFGYLRPAQTMMLLRATMKETSGEPPILNANQRRRLTAIPNLTPGDFAAIKRRAKLFERSADIDWWIAALERDAAAKPDAPRSAPGFLAAVS
ncbi:MAG TPA: AAA family ATPase [Gammaproteobacteria bacterium]|nr:AAA family ATPase [Gammaproteobacteria bacterium]